jgi:cytochrome c-type biogenesis protein CcmF
VNVTIGAAACALGLAASLLGIITLTIGLVRNRPDLLRLGRSYTWVLLGAAVVAFAIMERALITRDFTVAFVADNGSSRTPALFNFATLWSALEGSILLWVLILTGYLAAIVVKFRKRIDDPLFGWSLLAMFVVCAFFFLLLVGPANPFQSFDPPAGYDGPGPNPLLQNHVLMAVHPPILYLGYVGFTVPFAFAIGALATGRVGEGWLVETRRWTLFAWGFLSTGILLGAWWAHEVLGWGGYWGWDPVENASLLPWLTGTAFLHSVMVQERRGMLRVWNLSLVCATFALTILGTFLTRSGVVTSVHAFSNSDIGPLLLGFFGLVVAVTVGLIGWRGDRLRAPGRLDSPLSREAAFLANNLLFAAFAFVVLLGTVFPLIVEAVNDDRISVGRPYFEAMTMPIGMVLLFLMAIAPVLPWRKASGELLSQRLLWPAVIGVLAMAFALVVGGRGFSPMLAFGLGGFAAGSAGRQIVLATRRQGWRGFIGRTNGGMIVHLGVILVAVALVCSTAYSRGREFVLTKGVPVTYEGHTFEFVDVLSETDDRTTKIGAGVRVDGGQVYEPAFTLYLAQGMSVPTPSVRTGLTEDLYLTLTGTNPPKLGDTEARVKVEVKPLVLWLWIGGGMMAAGTVLAAFPGRRRRRPTDAASAPVPTSAPPAPTQHELVEA